MNRHPGARQTRRSIQQSFVSAGYQNIQNIPQKQTAPATQPQAAVVATVEAPQAAKSAPPPPMISSEPPQGNHNTEELELGQDDTMSSSGDGKVLFKKIFVTRKKSSIRAREKKMRQNRQLRKSILPKNALMALNEIKGITIGDFNIYQNETGFAAIMTVNGVQYEGSGVSKAAAKNDACEKALRDYILAKLIKHPRLPRKNTAKTTSNGSVADEGKPADGEPEPEAEEEQKPEMDEDGHDESMDCTEGDGEDPDDIPMVNLASFAIYKLFSEWESAGFCIPDMHPPTTNDPAASSEPKPPPKPTVRNELPPNYQDMHPATLLCIMRPGLTYTDIGCVGENPNILHQVKCTVDGQEFTAAGRSKKLARRFCAIQVCNTLFNTNFAQMEE